MDAQDMLQGAVSFGACSQSVRNRWGTVAISSPAAAGPVVKPVQPGFREEITETRRRLSTFETPAALGTAGSEPPRRT